MAEISKYMTVTLVEKTQWILKKKEEAKKSGIHQEMVNTEIAKLHAVTSADVLKQAQNILREENCSTLFYLKSEWFIPTD